MADKMAREFKKGTLPRCSQEQTIEPSATDYCNVVKVSKKANLTKENIGQMMLMQIPGISSTIAIELMRPFGSFIEFVDHLRANPNYLSTVTIKQRKIGSNIVKGIQEFIL
jgi:ERCC4-type nuclease